MCVRFVRRGGEGNRAVVGETDAHRPGRRSPPARTARARSGRCRSSARSSLRSPPSLLLPLPVSLLYTHSELAKVPAPTPSARPMTQAHGTRPPFPPVLSGHVSSLPPY
jgi:hypothetical protein